MSGERSNDTPRRRLAHALVAYALLAAVLTASIGACSAEQPGASTAAHDDTANAEPDAHDEHEGEDSDARVTLSEAALRTAEIQVEAARGEAGGVAGEALMLPGQVEFDPRRIAIISPKVAGRIERLLVVVGDRVGAGQPVADIYSAGYVTAQYDFLQAARRARTLAGTQDEDGARAIAEAARRRLTLMGVAAADLARLESSGEPRNELVLRAPFAGSIMEAGALAGQAVESGQTIFELADLSAADVVAAVPERSLPLVSIGQEATIALAAYPDRQFSGTVERIRDQLDPETRTVGAVIHVRNPAGRLRPGMFATVRLDVRAGEPAVSVSRAESGPRMVTIPEAAVVSDGESRYAFVEVGPRTYERREVAIVSLVPPGSSQPTTSRVGVTRGIAAGERVVVRGAFVLKSELAKASLGGHDH